MNPPEKILFVDDDPLLLDSLLRTLRGKFSISAATSGADGLRLAEREGPFAVAVADLRMPGMDGVTFLDRLLRLAPDTVRMILTGHADLSAAMDAVNKGHVFRFLTKPCQPAEMERALYDGIRQHQLLQTEREYYHLKRMNESLEGMINALVRLVETRDPYTAGHQAAVASLAAAVAGRMGLSDDKVREVELAATIHDIGKIYVPAEFLCKPGKLMPVEFDIIKLHPQMGHDILQPIGFTFPIHEIVLQHHERLDGSGYPHGLRGSQIGLAARLVAVADVTEAICAHRPYRPAKGLAAAMEELDRSRGRTHDEDVVKAALALLEEKGTALLGGGGD